MINIISYIFASVVLVSLVSFAGIFTLSLKTDRLKKILIYFVSFAAGALFGDAFLHLLPEVVEESGFTVSISLSIIAGIAFMFLAEKIIHWRHCHHPATKDHSHPFALMNLFGDAIHNFIDGLIIAASYLVSIPVGIATTLAVILHEIPQEISDFGVLIHGGFSQKKALLFNFITALTAILGAGVGLVLSSRIEHITQFLIPFAAGGFIYIAGADLIPELHKQVAVEKSIVQFITFVLGVLVMVLLLGLEV